MNLINSSLAKEGAKRNLAYLYVAKKLLNGDNVAVPIPLKIWWFRIIFNLGS